MSDLRIDLSKLTNEVLLEPSTIDNQEPRTLKFFLASCGTDVHAIVFYPHIDAYDMTRVRP